jgi:hypothetical protein
MTIHDQQQDLNLETDEDAGLITRRTVLRRSVLGIAGVGMASLLAACGGDDDDAGPTGADEIDDAPIDEDPAGGGDMDGADGGADTTDGAGGAG